MSELYSMKNRKKFSNTDTQNIFIQAGITSQVSLSKQSEKISQTLRIRIGITLTQVFF